MINLQETSLIRTNIHTVLLDNGDDTRVCGIIQGGPDIMERLTQCIREEVDAETVTILDMWDVGYGYEFRVFTKYTQDEEEREREFMLYQAPMY